MDKCREAFEQYIRSQSGFTADFKVDVNGQYKSDLMHFMFITWQEQQKRIDELNQENQKLVLSNTGYHNASASYLCKLMQIQFVLNQQIEIAKSKRADGEAFEDKTEIKIADYLDDYSIALDKILSDKATQEQFNAYAKGNEFIKQKERADKSQRRIDELQARLDNVKQLVQKWRDDPACYSELNVWECSARIIQALKGGEDQYQETRKAVGDRIKNGAKLTNHRIEL